METTTWIDIKEEGIPEDLPCEVLQEGGKIKYGCFHRTEYAAGIILLERKGKEFQWNGNTYLMKVTHWRYIN